MNEGHINFFVNSGAPKTYAILKETEKNVVWNSGFNQAGISVLKILFTRT